MLFDTHAHYDAPEFDQDRDALLARLPEQDVSLVVNPGCDPASSRAALELAGRYPFLYAAVGWHPENCAPYDGSLDGIRELAELGWMISFTGVLTYKNARRALEAAQTVPMDQIMIETDSPYMAPVPVRGRRNHSGNLCHICQRLAEVRGISYEECARITLENGKRFFSIP